MTATVFTWKVVFFKISPIMQQVFGLFFKLHLLLRSFKNRPIWSHWSPSTKEFHAYVDKFKSWPNFTTPTLSFKISLQSIGASSLFYFVEALKWKIVFRLDYLRAVWPEGQIISSITGHLQHWKWASRIKNTRGQSYKTFMLINCDSRVEI